MKPHERFVAWQQCHRLTLLTYQLTQAFPKSELYGITSQMRRSAYSAAANIVEGCAKRGASEFRRFLDISLGSLAELSYFALLARDLEFLSNDAWLESSGCMRLPAKRQWVCIEQWPGELRTGHKHSNRL